MAKNYDEQKVYAELGKLPGMQELTVAVEKIKDFAKKKIEQEIRDEEERINRYKELMQTINGN